MNVSPLCLKKDKPKGKLDHSAGNLFRARGVSPGDIVYIITVLDGELFLGGKITVEKVLSKKQAAAHLKTKNLWDAKDHILMENSKAKVFTPKNKVKTSTVKKLRYTSSAGIKPIKFYPDGRIHEQSLRGVRELTEESAKLLNASLGDGNKFPQW